MIVRRLLPRRCLLCGRWSRTIDYVVGITIGDFGYRCADHADCLARSGG